MLVDLTLEVTAEMVAIANSNLKRSFSGHLGTHFDIMNKTFPLDFCIRKGYVFDVSHLTVDNPEYEITPQDVDLSLVHEDMFVGFHTGFITRVPYGSEQYFNHHPQLSHELIDALLQKHVSLLGLDCSGMRNGAEHNVMDQHCADHGVFVVENMINLDQVAGKNATFYTFPIRFACYSGLPSRVVSEVN